MTWLTHIISRLPLRLLVLAPTLLATGCVSTQSMPLAADQAASIKRIAVHNAVSQGGLQFIVRYQNTPVNNSGGGAAGALAVLIAKAIVDGVANSKIQSEADKKTMAFATLHQELTDYDFRNEFTRKLAAAQHPNIQVTNVTESLTTLDDSQVSSLAKAVDVDAILALDTKYALSEDLARFVIETRARLFKTGGSTPIYVGTVSYRSPAITIASTQGIIDAWANNHAAPFREAATASMENLLQLIWRDMFVYSTQPTPTPNIFQRPRDTVVEKLDGFHIARTPRGDLSGIGNGKTTDTIPAPIGSNPLLAKQTGSATAELGGLLPAKQPLP